ncbi:AraC-like ligand-binding domain-containing protein [Glacieibacterium frigidum]|uniref:Helix-turn-helix domain-containing protein n=1 Tax=Glacieibacterium frigidum TaxID=2593303 RepID=A0A552U7I3_9SPHN|nr:helix-turn-helix domain-containing protein [Glacieibacterium frigidum]TRW14176.1 helix-turn-helix domain-containing protein [Glacieibacterium frigidum]
MGYDQPGSGEPIDERVETWRAAVRSAFVELHVEPVDRSGFRGSLTMAGRADLEVADIRAAGQRVERHYSAIRRSPSDHLYLVWQRQGRGCVENELGTAWLRPGDIVIYDPDRPHALAFEGNFAQVCVKVPRHCLVGSAGHHLDPMIGQRLAASLGSLRVLGAATQALLDEPEGGDDPFVAGLFLDALGRSLDWARRGREGDGARAFGRGDRMRRFVRENFRAEGLAPADAAAALGCSLRQVHMICAEMGTTFGRLLLSTRLEAVRQAILDGRGDRLGTIAFDCGFRDPSHFARTFKAKFGTAPREFGRVGPTAA